MTIRPPYHALPSAYFIHVRLGFQTWWNQPALQPLRQLTVQRSLVEIFARCEYHALAESIQPNRVELLLSLQPQQSVTQVVTTIKTNLSRFLLAEHPELAAEMGGRRMWAGSYEVETTGAASTAQIKSYIDDQRTHHSTGLQAPGKVARYQAPDKVSYKQFHHKGRAVYRLHYHIVLTVKGFQRVIDEPVANYLTRTFLRIADVKGYTPLAFDILDSHVHLLVSVAPNQPVQSVAEAIMNNSSVMTLQRFTHLQRLFPDDQLWIPGFFVRSTGRTTAQVKAALTAGM